MSTFTPLTVRSRAVTLHVADSGTAAGPAITHPATAVTIAHALIGSNAQESIVTILLDARHRVTGHAIIAQGTLNATRCTPRDIFTPALISGAAYIIVAHNHPSGDPTPSAADRRFITMANTAAELLGIPILDHIIVTAQLDAFWSYAAEVAS